MNTISITARQMIGNYEFVNLFIEELGWNRLSGEHYVTIDDDEFLISAIAEKAGFVVYSCTSDLGEIPDHSTRRRIEREVRKLVHEHLIIFHDSEKTHQIWQWIRRETGKPEASREHSLWKGQTGEALCQRVINLTVSLEEEEGLTILAMQERAKKAFDVEKVTKRFYDNFKKEHDQFLKFLNGIPDKDMEKWYVSVMLNRLMFIYFIQKKGFLGRDQDYLKNQLIKSKKQLGTDRYYSDFLCPLFFEGFAKTESDRSADTNKLLGQVPYLNGGIFLPHQVEQLYGETIKVPDKAFDKLFGFFDAYQWHLDERPLRRDDEINPDVLGYIFEKYINQKQMGAYYTKEDITEYISKNTVVPFLLDRAIEKCKVAFEGDQSVWNMLRDDPIRYIYEPVRRGVIRPDGSIIPETDLPEFVQEGMHEPKARMFNNDYNLGRASLLDEEENELTLPTETWREYVDRRKRCLDLRQKLINGEIHEVNDLVTNNLDIRQIIQDIIDRCEGPDLLNTIWSTIKDITILDPTCGSGAFLFAALNILYPLYDACLERMRFFLNEWGEDASKHHPNYTKWFSQTLENAERHPNHRYFILKSIIVQNLYGVDIMEEAAEICKLRFFLKLVAQVEKLENLEPLPDIDFNIRSGNALVGYVSIEDVRKALASDLIKKLDLPRIEEEARLADRAFHHFRQMQNEMNMSSSEFSNAKNDLKSRLEKLNDELNHVLAKDYGIDSKNTSAFDKWLSSHEPFHWFSEFYGILDSGGFDVIIGNPPYVVYRDVSDYKIINLECLPCNDLYAFVLERSLRISSFRSWLSMIVPISLGSTNGFIPLRQLLRNLSSCIWMSNFSMRPSKLFDGAEKHLSICTVSRSNNQAKSNVYTSKYYRWLSEAREALFPNICYEQIDNRHTYLDSIPKIGSNVEKSTFEKMLRCKTTIGGLLKPSGSHILYHTRKLRYFVQFLDTPPKIVKSGVDTVTSELKKLKFERRIERNVNLSFLSSSLFYWFFLLLSDCRNLNRREVIAMPVEFKSIYASDLKNLDELAIKLMKNLQENSYMKFLTYQKHGEMNVQMFLPRLSKPIIDKIDQVLARHYGFTEEELDFIINYDIKYRMGINTRENHA